MGQQNILTGFETMASIFCLIMLTMVLVACVTQSPANPKQALHQNPVAAFEWELRNLQEKYNILGMSVAILHKQNIIFADG
jgi:hypothetical protein